MATKPPTDVSNDPRNGDMLVAWMEQAVDHTEEEKADRLVRQMAHRLATWEQLRDALEWAYAEMLEARDHITEATIQKVETALAAARKEE